MGNGLIERIDTYGTFLPADRDMSFRDAKEIISGSRTKMEIAGNSYIYGYMMGSTGSKKMVPVLNIKQISDEEWNKIAKRQKEERK